MLLCLVGALGCTSRISPAADTRANSDSANGSSDDSSFTETNNDAALTENTTVPTKPLSTASADDDVQGEIEPPAKNELPVDQLASAANPAASTTEAEPKPEPAAKTTRTRDITFDTIKFEMKKEEPFVRSMLTPAIEKLFGARIRIRGYILPSYQSEGITQFVLVRDNMECCFGPGAALFDCIVVEMSPGKTARFTTRPVAVEGVFSINEIKYPDDENRHLAIYHLAADKVQ